MASLKYSPEKRQALIQFYDSSRIRRSARLTDVSKTFADGFTQR